MRQHIFDALGDPREILVVVFVVIVTISVLVTKQNSSISQDHLVNKTISSGISSIMIAYNGWEIAESKESLSSKQETHPFPTKIVRC